MSASVGRGAVKLAVAGFHEIGLRVRTVNTLEVMQHSQDTRGSDFEEGAITICAAQSRRSVEISVNAERNPAVGTFAIGTVELGERGHGATRSCFENCSVAKASAF